MATIIISKKENHSFVIDVHRENVVGEQNENTFYLYDIQRTAVQQIERYLKRMINEDYFNKLMTDKDESLKIKRLYEIGARR